MTAATLAAASQDLLRHTFVPRGAAKRLFECRDSEVLLGGPAGTGKSRAALEKLHLQMLKYPGARALILRKTATSLTNTGLVTYKEHVAREALATGEVTWRTANQHRAGCFEYRNGSTINVGGMDKDKKIMSSEYDVVFVQEAIELTVTDWEAITTRLRNGVMPYQQLIADTNPSHPTHWLKQRCDRGDTTLIESRHEDNPVYFNDDRTLTPAGVDYIQGKLDKLTGVRYQRLRLGKWAAAEGLIYEDWDEAVHLVNGFYPPNDWARYWSIDFGFNNPFVWQEWAEDPDGRLYLFREIYRKERTVDQHCAAIRSLVMHDDGTWRGPQPQAIVADHDAENRAQFERYLGLHTKAANKKVTQGVQAVQRRLRRADDGRPRLFIMRNALKFPDKELQEARKPICTAEEITGYAWAVKPGEKVDEQPRKEDDHGMDAMRYVVAHRDLTGRVNVRWL